MEKRFKLVRFDHGDKPERLITAAIDAANGNLHAYGVWVSHPEGSQIGHWTFIGVSNVRIDEAH